MAGAEKFPAYFILDQYFSTMEQSQNPPAPPLTRGKAIFPFDTSHTFDTFDTLFFK
jgi:hypothetical protein